MLGAPDTRVRKTVAAWGPCGRTRRRSSSGSTADPRFFTVSVLALGINLAALEILIKVVEFPELAAQAIAVAFAMPFNFIGNKLWTFV